MGEVYVITSGKGGVGKTTVTANLGIGLALRGARVVTVDADIGLRNLDVVLGLENRIVFNIVDVVEGNCRLEQALVRDKRVENLFLLPAAQTRTKEAVSPEQMIEVCSKLREMFDYVLVDSPAGIESGFRNAAIGADKGIVVTTPEVSAVRDADRIIGLLEAMEKGTPQLIINRLRVDMVEKGDMLSVRDVLDILAIPLLGIVPEDEEVIVATNKGEPVILRENSDASRAFKNIVARLRGEDVPLVEPSSKKDAGFWGKIRKLFGGR